MMRKYSNLLMKRTFVLVAVLAVYMLLSAIQIAVMELTSANILAVMAGVILINIWIIFKVVKNGFKYFKGTSTMDISFSICYGLMCYLCLLSQIALIFFYYYFYYEGYGVVPAEVAQAFNTGETDLLTDFRIVLNYVFPNFYKFPTAQGIMVVIQFYIGKFTDLFILAFIVEKIKKHASAE